MACCAEHRGRQGTERRADGEEVRAQAADEPFDEGLEERCGREGVAKAHDLQLSDVYRLVLGEWERRSESRTAALLSQKSRMHQSPIAPITKKGTANEMMALTSVVMYSARSGLPCWRPQEVVHTPSKSGKYRGINGVAKRYMSSAISKQVSWVAISSQETFSQVLKGGLLSNWGMNFLSMEGSGLEVAGDDSGGV